MNRFLQIFGRIFRCHPSIGPGLLRFPVGEDVNENIDSLLVPSRGQPANVHYPTGGPPSLSLMDFALMASLTYENPKRFE